MISSALWCKLSFRDREGNVGTTSAYVALSLSDSLLLSFLNSFAPVVQALSNAHLFKVEVYRTLAVEGTPEPAIDADVSRFIGLFLRNDDYAETLYIPAPKAEMFETTGIYTGIRTDATSSIVVSFAEAAATVLSFTTTQEGDPYPTIFVVGGLVL